MGMPANPSVLLLFALAGPAWAGRAPIVQPHRSAPVTSQSSPLLPASAIATASHTAASWTSRHAAVADPATLCETAVTTAEYAGRLPSGLLSAISLTESGRVEPATGRARPWPWTINAGGEGQFFETRQAAITAAKALQDRGIRSIDVGCLQVNLMYHADAFASLQDAFDPRTNANYAARFLNTLYADSKDWEAAVAAYHSETPGLGEAYRVSVMARWQNGHPHAPITGRVAYGDFAGAGKAYGDKPHIGGSYGDPAYRAFEPSSLVYGAFAPR